MYIYILYIECTNMCNVNLYIYMRVHKKCACVYILFYTYNIRIQMMQTCSVSLSNNRVVLDFTVRTASEDYQLFLKQFSKAG